MKITPRKLNVSLMAAASLALTLQVDAASSYLVIANSTSIPPGLAAKLGSAGGRITTAIPELGILAVSSDNPGFKAAAAKISNVRSVVPNLRIQRPQTLVKAAGPAPLAGNPPFSDDDDLWFNLQWGHTAIQAPDAWNAGYRGAGALVAVLDEGFDLTHPDLAPNIDSTASMVPGEGAQYSLADEYSHGTHVAGTVAAADNGYGVIGVAPEARLMLVKVLSEQLGYGLFEWILAGIVHATDHGADIINMSLGSGPIPKSGIPGEATAKEIAELRVAVGRATTYAYQKGVTVIAAAGNEAIDGDHTANVIVLPSDAPHVLAISATGPLGWVLNPNTNLDVPAFYSNYGQSEIDFAAPGGNVDFNLYPFGPWYFDLVLSTGSLGSFYWSAGTSMAAPHASGVAALIVGKHGGSLAPAAVIAALRNGAEDLGKPGNDDYFGAGRVNAFRSVAE